jgi:hypothetical protein
MSLAKCLQFKCQNQNNISGGLFALGILTDYRADWALADSLEQVETIQAEF